MIADGYTPYLAQIFRSNFAETGERFAAIGGLDDGGSFTLPPRSVATVVIDRIQP